MNIKYFGTSYEKGLTLTATVYNVNGGVVHANIPVIETAVNSAVYIANDIEDTIGMFDKGVYVVRIIDSDNNFLGHSKFIWDGVQEVTLATLNISSFTEQEMMQIRDALGVDGDKMVARNGQLQKKSEHPYNDVIDTNNL